MIFLDMEMLDVFDINGKHVGTMERKKAHGENAGAYHKAVHIWFVNDKGEILVQKRADFKYEHPNMWDIPSAGHVDAGESLLVIFSLNNLRTQRPYSGLVAIW